MINRPPSTWQIIIVSMPARPCCVSMHAHIMHQEIIARPSKLFLVPNSFFFFIPDAGMGVTLKSIANHM